MNSTVYEYISQFSQEVQIILNKIRKDISTLVPKAQETISYGIPTFTLNGKILIHFAACKKHIGFYPTPSGIYHFKKKLSPYDTTKGSIKFPFDKPIPFDLIKEIVQYRVDENTNN